LTHVAVKPVAIYRTRINFMPRSAVRLASQRQNVQKGNCFGVLNRKPGQMNAHGFLCRAYDSELGWIGVKGWLAKADVPVDLKLEALKAGQRYRFRLRANPCVTRNGKRLGLLQLVEQERWIQRKGQSHGFILPQLPAFDCSEVPEPRIDVTVSQERMLSGMQHHGNSIRIFSVLYDGVMTVTDADAFVKVLHTGIGHGKALGLGLLSVAPIG
jgi:hypothetical protein